MRDCSEDRACWQEKNRFQAVNGSVGDGDASPAVARPALGPQPAGRAFFIPYQARTVSEAAAAVAVLILLGSQNATERNSRVLRRTTDLVALRRRAHTLIQINPIAVT